MPHSRNLGKEFNLRINEERKQLKIIEKKLKDENISLKNIKYLKMLSKASAHKQRITFLQIQKSLYTRHTHKQIIINVGSRVKLLSTRVGEVFFVDAKNYLELLGKSIGDAVIMNNSIFLVAGIY